MNIGIQYEIFSKRYLTGIFATSAMTHFCSETVDQGLGNVVGDNDWGLLLLLLRPILAVNADCAVELLTSIASLPYV